MRKKRSIIIPAGLGLMLLLGLAGCGKKGPGYVKIDHVNFPDFAFRSRIADNFDQDGDGYLSPKELGEIKDINFSNCGIGDLTGLQYFDQLETLNCSSNSIKELDTSSSPNLKVLDCSVTQIEKLTVSENPELIDLDLEDDALRQRLIFSCQIIRYYEKVLNLKLNL